MIARLVLIATLSALLLSLGGCATNRTADANAEQGAAELYAESQRQLQRGDFRGAATTLQDLQARHPFGPYFKQAQLDLIFARFHAEEMEAAVRAADRFIRLNPRSEHLEYALYMRGRAQQTQGSDFLARTFRLDHRIRDASPLRGALRDFQQLLDAFPDSAYRADVMTRVDTLRRDLAFHELHVARFYLKRNAHVAAANRALALIHTFPDTPEAEEALALIQTAYAELELGELSTEAERLLRERGRHTRTSR
jgi:outer membrane protein assembly factor BamD